MGTIAIDFDGVIAEYDPPMGSGNFGHPIAGTREGLANLKELGWTIVVNTTRLEVDLIKEYMKLHLLDFDYVNFNPRNDERNLHPSKTSADIYGDDRAIQFRGNWRIFVDEVKNFKEWWKKD